MALNGLTYDGEMYRWSKSFVDLKSFVEASLNITGKWTSPGGNAKLFKSDGDGEFIIKWHGPRSNRLAIQSDNLEQYLKLKFESLIKQCQTGANIPHEAVGVSFNNNEAAAFEQEQDQGLEQPGEPNDHNLHKEVNNPLSETLVSSKVSQCSYEDNSIPDSDEFKII